MAFTKSTLSNAVQKVLRFFRDGATGPYLPGVVIVDEDGDQIVPSSSAQAVITTPTHSVVTVTVASGVALAANTSRSHALLINDSDTPIYLMFGAAAVANQGVRLNAAGGSYEMSSLLGNLYRGAINAIHGGTGNKVLLVDEGV